jgi:phytoene synthase
MLRQWRGALERSLAGDALSADHDREYTVPDMVPGALAAVDPRGRTILPAVVETVREYHIPPESLLAVLDGIEMDLEPRVYATFDELAVYCQRVASAVGLACIHIWGFHGSPGPGGNVLGPSRSAGLALQLTNILRDLSEDARRGRVYLPLEDLRACGYSAEELRGGVANRPFLRLMEMEIDRAEQFYREAAELPRSLHKDGHRIFGLMMETYHALLEAIRRRPGDVFAQRIRVSRWKKLSLALRWSFLPVKPMK